MLHHLLRILPMFQYIFKLSYVLFPLSGGYPSILSEAGGRFSWYLAVSLHWRYNSGVRKFLNKSIRILNKLNFAAFLLFSLLSLSSHPEHRPRTIFGSQKRWHQLSTVMKDGKKKITVFKVAYSRLINSNTTTVLCSVLEGFFLQEGSHIFGRCGFLPPPRLKK